MFDIFGYLYQDEPVHLPRVMLLLEDIGLKSLIKLFLVCLPDAKDPRAGTRPKEAASSSMPL